ncbi:MAG: hypothetical protein D3908_12760, partial [Candidatus Electrothrix sp. AUS4]|nr:hypothetical protein [Candidatus Electrothrix sp. AUS4]
MIYIKTDFCKKAWNFFSSKDLIVKMIYSISFVMIFLFLFDDIKLMARARIFYFQNNYLYTKFNQYTAIKYIDIISSGQYYDAKNFYDKFIEKKFNEKSMSYIYKYKEVADAAVEKSKESYGKYKEILNKNNNVLTRIGVAYLYKAYNIYPKNNEFINELSRVHNEFDKSFQSIPIFFDECQ